MKLYDLDVQLMTESGQPLPEYGFVKTDSTSSAMVYTPSIANTTFYIRAEANVHDPTLPKSAWENLSISVYINKESTCHENRDAATLITKTANCAELRGKMAMLADGTAVEQKWMFVEMGIESRLESFLTLADGDGEQCSGSGGERPKYESGGAGSIKIVFNQVRVVDTLSRIKWPMLDEGGEPVDVANHSRMDHTIGYRGLQELPYKEYGYRIKRVNPDNKPYATMLFLYRDVHQLKDMGFLGAATSLDMGNPVDKVVAELSDKMSF